MKYLVKRFLITNQCIKNRTVDGIISVITTEVAESMRKVVLTKGVGTYEISFKKIDPTTGKEEA